MSYTDLTASLDRAIERTQGQATLADEEWLTEMLTLSAGTVESTTHYRPYYVAAKLLEQKLAAQTLSEADGAVFTGLATPIASLLNLQASYDSAMALTVPAGFEAIPPVQKLRSRAIQRIPSP
jgi:hypothetical protein